MRQICSRFGDVTLYYHWKTQTYKKSYVFHQSFIASCDTLFSKQNLQGSINLINYKWIKYFPKQISSEAFQTLRPLSSVY